MNRIQSHLKVHYVNSKKSFVIFWSIMFAISIIGILITLYSRSKGFKGTITINHMPAVVIFGAISGLVSYNETLPYMLNMGITRKSFILGFIAYNIVLSLVLSILFVLLTLWETLAYNLLGFTSQQIGHIFTGVEGVFSRAWLCFIITLAATVIFTLIASIYYKKGMMFLFGIGALIMLIMFIPGVAAAVFRVLEYIVLYLIGDKGYPIKTFYSMVFFLACYLIIYPLTRTSQVKR
ncbi:MAG: hypothetical protein GX201_01100 [Clostridiales bacterium]|nr:hypothetical protein [Clostridiales bacterium]